MVSGLTLFAGGPLPASPWLALLFLLPLLTLVVRGNVIAFQWLFQRRHGAEPPSLLDSVISVVFYGVGLGAIAHYWFKLELTPFLATSAVVGAVVGLALQDTLGNLFAGIALHTEAPFRVGDWVRVADRDGRIEQVSWRAMRLRTWDGDTLTIPNNEVSRHAMLNYSVPAVAALAADPRQHRVPRPRPTARSPCCAAPWPRSRAWPRARLPTSASSATRTTRCGTRSATSSARTRTTARIEGEIYRLVWYHLRRAGIEFALPDQQRERPAAPAAPRAEDAARPRCCPRSAASTCSSP